VHGMKIWYSGDVLGDRLMVGQRPLAPLIGVRVPIPQKNSEAIFMGEESNGVAFGRDSKAGAGPQRARWGARQGRAAVAVTAAIKRLTESLSPR
jgi:hypothetical protein